LSLQLQQPDMAIALFRPVQLNRTSRLLDIALMVGICLLLGFGPLAFGAVQEWAVCVLESGSILLIVLWSARELARGRFEMVPNSLFLPSVAFAALVVLQLTAHLSAYWYASWQEALLWAAYGMILFVVTQTFRRRVTLKWLGLVATIYGFIMATFAIAQQFTWNGKVFWIVNNPHGGAVYGSYIDHAHYAGLMEMLAPIPLVYAMAGVFSKPIRVLSLFAALIMSSSIFLSQSLGGILAFSLELVALALLSLRRRGSFVEPVILAVLCILLVVWLAGLHPVGLSDRLAKLQNPLHEGGALGRLVIVKDSIEMVRQRPLLGWGFGTFPVVYPSFRSFYSDFWINEAHNDYVQMLVETGFVGFAISISFLASLYVSAFSNIYNWRHDLHATTSLAALIGCTGLLAHGLCDFNLQIPANAALFFSLAALATRQTYPNGKQDRNNSLLISPRGK
jgi:O-antigen ligase